MWICAKTRDTYGVFNYPSRVRQVVDFGRPQRYFVGRLVGGDCCFVMEASYQWFEWFNIRVVFLPSSRDKARYLREARVVVDG